ncbi:hypothetical protein ACFUJR_24705 [Streptomyces sp. NPDC057271]|uniref:hypothetical protein n=1 Tax=unclassified Streptomyces TaxID=2593676 RepID=UPI0036281201
MAPIIVAVGDETGIVGVARDFDRQLYVLADRSGSMCANDWGLAVCRLALELKADAIVVEKENYAGDALAHRPRAPSRRMFTPRCTSPTGTPPVSSRTTS